MVITGTRTGIGRFLAEYYVQAGYHVVGCSRGISDLQVPGYEHVEMDVADEPAVAGLFNRVRKSLGRMDVLVNNAGLLCINNLLLTPLATLEAVFRTNVRGIFLCCREAVKVMMPARRGRIVNLTSIASGQAFAGTGVYSSSKAAVEQLTRVLAAETAPMGIAVNALSLPPVRESGMAAALSSRGIGEALAHTRLGRMIEMPEVAVALDSLLAAEPSVTGQIVHVGGLQ